MSTTADILCRLKTAQKELPEAIDTIKKVIVPAAEMGGEVLTHVGLGALSGVTGLPLQKFGMFAAPAVGKLVGAATELALDGVEKAGDAMLSGTGKLIESIDKSLNHKPEQQTPYKTTLRLAARAA